MTALRSFSGPRIKYTPEDSLYEAITVDKLTPIIGAEIGDVDLRAPVCLRSRNRCPGPARRLWD